KKIGLGAWRWPIAVAVVAWLVVSVGLPVTGVVIRSFVSAWGLGVNLLEHLTFANFANLLEVPTTRRAIVNSALVGVVGGLASLLVFAVISLAARKGRKPLVALVDYTILLPRAMPGLVMGLAIFWIILFV